MYYVIFVCKYRRKILEPISNALKNAIIEIEKDSDFEIVEIETDKDHIHLLIKSELKVSTLAIVRRLKQCTTISLWKIHKEYLKKYYWKEHTLWSDGYFVCSVGNASKEVIEEYIRNQGQVDAYIRLAEDQVVLRFDDKNYLSIKIGKIVRKTKTKERKRIYCIFTFNNTNHRQTDN